MLISQIMYMRAGSSPDEPDNSQMYTGTEEDYLQVCVDWNYRWNDSAVKQDSTAGIGFICEWELDRDIEVDDSRFGKGSFFENIWSFF